MSETVWRWACPFKDCAFAVEGSFDVLVAHVDAEHEPAPREWPLFCFPKRAVLT